MSNANEQEVVQLFRTFQDAANQTREAYLAGVRAGTPPDRASLERLAVQLGSYLPEDYTLVDPFGDVVDKQHCTDRVRSGANLFVEYERSEHDVRFYGGTAVYISLVSLKGERSGLDVSGEYRETHILRKPGSQWEIVASQMTRVDHTHHLSHTK